MYKAAFTVARPFTKSVVSFWDKANVYSIITCEYLLDGIHNIVELWYSLDVGIFPKMYNVMKLLFVQMGLLGVLHVVSPWHEL